MHTGCRTTKKITPRTIHWQRTLQKCPTIKIGMLENTPNTIHWRKDTTKCPTIKIVIFENYITQDTLDEDSVQSVPPLRKLHHTQ